METGDYISITVTGGAPWGFSIHGGEDLQQPLLVSQVDGGGPASQAGLLQGDEVVSLNEKPGAGLTSEEVTALLRISTERLQLLVKRLHPCRKPCIFESQDGAHNMGKERDVKLMGGTQRTWTRGGKLSREFSGSGLPNKGSIPPKAMVELSLSDHPLKEPPHMKAKTTLGIGGHTEVLGGTDSATQSLYFYHSSQEQQGQGGGLLGSYSCSLVQVGVTLQHPGGGRHQGEARASGWVHPLEEGGNIEAPPALGSFGISAVGAERAERWDSESERELDQPSRHRARHARFRRSESQLEKQAKVAKSKCKRIALLLTAAPNSKNKGVLMFEKHRERAKKYTLVSYGTGKEEPEPDDEEEAEEDYHRVKVTFLTDGETQPDKEAFANALGCGITVNFDKDCAPLNVDKKPDDQRGMEYLPETKGKGALMFARRRQRIDEIAAAHEEMRRKGIPVEGPPGPDNAEVTPSYQAEEYSYKQLPDSHPSKVNLGIQQHQAQPNPPTMNGATHMQATDVQRFHVPNRTAQPFSGVPNRVPASFSPPVSTPSPVLDHPAYSESKHRVVPVSTRPQVLSPTDREQIVSRDERISVPAIKTGMLHDTKKRNTAKTAFRPKEFPTMSQILNPKGDKTAGFESSAEEDYLSLGAEACNFLQTPAVKHKTPPPVAPKPSINLACPPWSTNNTQLPLGSESPALATAPTVSPSQVSSAQQHTTTSTWSPPELHPPLQQPVSALDSPLSKVQSQPSGGFWGTSQHQAPTQPSWAQPCAPVSTAATAQSELRSSWNQPYISANAMASHLSQGLSSNIYGPKVRSVGSISSGRAMSPASDMPTMRGRGAELFAKRQSRMEKFVVDSETVQANKARAQSPTPSLPSAWKYSPNVRAPPPVSYNPLLTPSYPLAAVKQPPPSSSKAKPKSNVTGKSAPKHLNSLDVMKHQPYQLNASLFTYSPSLEEKDNSSASPGPTPTGQITKPTGPVSVPFASQPLQQPQATPKPHQLSGVLLPSPTLHDGPHSHAPATSSLPAFSISAVQGFPTPFKPQSVSGITRLGAPRPKFSAKKQALATKLWKPVVKRQY